MDGLGGDISGRLTPIELKDFRIHILRRPASMPTTFALTGIAAGGSRTNPDRVIA